ncbi:MAG: DUF5118 domain-containing protein, partial [Flavobacteriaceae bacterium]
MKSLQKISLLLIMMLILQSCSISIKATSNKKNKAQVTEKPKPKPKPKKGDIKPYSDVITKDAISDSGLFKVHKIDTDFFYEIPDTLFEKEMLMVTRIAKTASGIGFGGGKQNTQVVRWVKKRNK